MGNLVIPVILCGGAGTRLWPASNDATPKPFLPLVDGRSTFDLTLERVSDDSLFAPPLIVANRLHRYLVADACAGTPGATILLEPQPRDTAAAIAAAASWASAQDPEAVILILAADHLIRDVDGFAAAIRIARAAAEAGYIVVFGVRPTTPATGYGYIRRGAPVDGIDAVDKVAAFVEKPDVATAERYIAAGYLWNSGNFMMQAATALSEVGRTRAGGRRSRQGRGRRSEGRRQCRRVRGRAFFARDEDLVRSRGDGEDRSCGRRRGRLRLVGSRDLVLDLGSRGEGRCRQRRDR